MGMESNNGLNAQIPESGRPEAYRPRNRSSVAGGGNLSQIPNRTQAPPSEEQDPREVQNQRAMEVLARVKEKLTGKDFKNEEAYKVDVQVDRLIREATNLENLCQHYIGWCSFW
jgi:FKBP12-rapamycin complex-associated protein